MANWISNADMGDTRLVKECFGPLKCAVDELIYNNEVTGLHILTKTTACGKRDKVGDPYALHCTDIGTVGYIAGCMYVATAVAWQERHMNVIQYARKNFVRWNTEWRIYRYPMSILHTVNIVYTGAANYAKFDVFHGYLPKFFLTQQGRQALDCSKVSEC